MGRDFLNCGLVMNDVYTAHTWKPDPNAASYPDLLYWWLEELALVIIHGIADPQPELRVKA